MILCIYVDLTYSSYSNFHKLNWIMVVFQ